MASPPLLYHLLVSPVGKAPQELGSMASALQAPPIPLLMLTHLPSLASSSFSGSKGMMLWSEVRADGWGSASGEGVRSLVCRAVATGRMPAQEALLREPFPSPATTGNRSGNPPHKFFKLHLEARRAICRAGWVPGSLVHQKCRVCLFF